MKTENTDLFQSIAQTITVKVGGFKERKTVALDRVNMAYDLIVCRVDQVCTVLTGSKQ